MADLTQEGQRIVEDTAKRYGMSTGAVQAVLEALVSGGGTMAQFNHPELGGMGQWTRGGMTMIGDMFNNGLKTHIDSLCSELSAVIGSQELLARHTQSSRRPRQQEAGHALPGETNPGKTEPSGRFFLDNNDGYRTANWWPADLGMPTATGAQNTTRYAYFPDARRVALDVDGEVSVYDTGQHQISGFTQQQGSDQSVALCSQYGLVPVYSLLQVSGPGSGGETGRAGRPAADAASLSSSTMSLSRADICSTIERLAQLRDRGVISEKEFCNKKSDLLDRL